MGDFSWNLGGEDATASDSHQTHPQSAEPALVVPAQPLTRRELRHRAEAASGKRTSARPVETTESTVPEFFQVREPQNTEAHTPVTSHAVPKKAKKIHSHETSSTQGTRAASSRLRRKFGRRRTLFSQLFSISAMIGVGALMVSTSLPANAFYNASDAAASTTKSLTSHAQSMKVASAATETTVARDSYTVSSLAAQLRLKYGNQIFSYSNDVNGTIQWPFPIPVPISSGFGPRIAPCGGCSSFHEGIDFAPGRGVAIGAIADGVVSAVVNTHAGLGNHVIVDHVINGQKVQSVYGHMLDGSIVVTVGEQVKVTQTLGLVGSTGESTGPHLHLEIHINGVPVDPFAWLKANAN